MFCFRCTIINTIFLSSIYRHLCAGDTGATTKAHYVLRVITLSDGTTPESDAATFDIRCLTLVRLDRSSILSTGPCWDDAPHPLHSPLPPPPLPPPPTPHPLLMPPFQERNAIFSPTDCCRVLKCLVPVSTYPLL